MINDIKKIKVMTVLGTRPEIIRLSRVMSELDKYVNQIVVFTGQNFTSELSDVFFKQLKLRRPDYTLGVRTTSFGEQVSDLFAKGQKVLLKEKPDVFLVLGDTNSALMAIIAKRNKIPIFHMEAGNRCFDERVPEEINRKIIDHISDINLPYTEHGRRYLIGEGIHPGSIFVTGSPLAEVFDYYQQDIEKSKVLKELDVHSKRYFLVSIHREENVSDKKRLVPILDSLNNLTKIYKLPIIFSTHPKTEQYLKKLNWKNSESIKFCPPFGYFDYINLQKNAICVLSDSGTIQEEASIISFPAVQIRMSSERPEAFDTGNVILAGVKEDAIIRAVDLAIKQDSAGDKFQIPRDYKDLNVSSKVVRLIVGLGSNIKNNRN